MLLSFCSSIAAMDVCCVLLINSPIYGLAYNNLYRSIKQIVFPTRSFVLHGSWIFRSCVFSAPVDVFVVAADDIEERQRAGKSTERHPLRQTVRPTSTSTHFTQSTTDL